jgi:hypothetical protein
VRNNIYNSQRLVNNYSLALAGTNQHALSATNKKFNIATNFSVSVWFRSHAAGVIKYIVSCTTSTNSPIANGFLLYHSAAGVLTFQISAFDVGARAASDVTAITNNTWYHALGTYDGAFVRLYKNGVLGSTITAASGVWNFNTSSALRLCNTPSAGAAQHFIGNVDEVSIWNSALTQSDAIKLYNAGRPTNLLVNINYPNLQGWWRCGDGDVAPILTDSSRRGNVSLTMTNTPIIAPVTVWRG